MSINDVALKLIEDDQARIDHEIDVMSDILELADDAVLDAVNVRPEWTAKS